MTLARVRNNEVVEVTLPERLKGRVYDDLYKNGWRQVKGTPKPDPTDDGLKWVYGGPYTYNADEDAVYGEWSQKDLKAAQLQASRERAALSRADFKLALYEMGELETVKSAMEASDVDPRAKILWEDAQLFKRLDNDLLKMAETVGYTDEKLDQLFGIK